MHDALRRAPLRALALALVALLAALPARAQETTPPPTDGGPIEVRVSILLVDLFRILDAEQAVEADLFYRIEWNDPRLAEPGAEQRTMSLASVWHPTLQPLSPRGLNALMPQEVLVDEEGTVGYAQRLTGTFGAPTNLHDFPFDSHELRLAFVVANMGETRVELLPGEVAGVSEQLSIPDWSIEDGGLDLTPATVMEGIPPVPCASLVLRARRDLSYYLTKVIFPLSVIVMISWTVFWVPPPQIAVQFGFAATSLLNVIAYRFALATQLPRVPYSTRMDTFLTGAFVLVALALVEVVVTGQLLYKERADAAHKVDVACRITFPVMLVALAGYSFLV